MRVALVNCNYTRVANAPPLGLLSIASVLISNCHEVRIYDIFPENMNENINEIKKFSPEIIAFSITSFQVQTTKKVIKKLRKKIKKAIFVGGGVHVSTLPEYSLRSLNFDICVFGEGEMTFLELCKTLDSGMNWKKIDGICYISNKKFISNKPRELIKNLDELPFPARFLIPMEKYLLPGGTVRGMWLDRTTTVMTSRGCPGRCIFCSSKILFGRRTRRRSVDNVIDEIIYLEKKYGITALYFMDDTFTINKKWIMEFCKKMIEKCPKIKWACQSRVDTVDVEMMMAMKKAGLVQMEFGIESGSEKILKIIKKDVDLKKVRKTIKDTRKIGIKTLVTFILGIPGENMLDVKTTIEFARELKADHYEFYFAEPFPGTELHDIAKEKNLILSDTVPEDGEFPFATCLDFKKIKPSMKSELDVEELISIRNQIHKEFPRFTLMEKSLYFYNLLKLSVDNIGLVLRSIIKSLSKRTSLRSELISALEIKIKGEIKEADK